MGWVIGLEIAILVAVGLVYVFLNSTVKATAEREVQLHYEPVIAAAVKEATQEVEARYREALAEIDAGVQHRYNELMEGLRRENDAQLARLQHRLAEELQKDYLRFSLFHERQVGVVVELYGLLSAAAEAVREHLSGASGKPDAEARAAAHAAYDALRAAYLKDRIFLVHTDLEGQIGSVIEGLRQALTGREGADLAASADVPPEGTESLHAAAWERLQESLDVIEGAMRETVRSLLRGRAPRT